METLRSQVLAYALDNYGTQPDTPWAKYPENQVLRHRGSKKWYALIMRVKRKVLGQTEEGTVDVINLKCTGITREILIKESLGQPAYHMNKKSGSQFFWTAAYRWKRSAECWTKAMNPRNKEVCHD